MRLLPGLVRQMDRQMGHKADGSKMCQDGGKMERDGSRWGPDEAKMSRDGATMGLTASPPSAGLCAIQRTDEGLGDKSCRQ